MMSEWIAGLLLHPTSLPSPFGIGDLGSQADRFLDWAAGGGAAIWQVLPLGPTAHGDSPYSSPSAFAGNPRLLSPEQLRREGLLSGTDLGETPRFPAERADFARVDPWKEKACRISYERFRRRPPAEIEREFQAFASDPGRAGWLEDWALYSALKARLGGKSWSQWPVDLRRREPGAMERARRDLAEETAYHRYLQFVFHRQWQRVREEAHRRGIRILGDLPLYVALDSSDVWANPGLFDLDDNLLPRNVAGVPPDYFSEKGQRWGNPLYLWERMAEEGYAWWIARFRENLRQVDLLRIDHFRGLETFWEIPAEETTAVKGAWRPGPGEALFKALRGALGDIPVVAEDLGIITDSVRELKKSLGLPGMKVLQFAFDSDDSDHLPGRFPPENVIYTGTHDNDTTRGWFEGLGEGATRRRVLEFLGAQAAQEIHWEMIRAAFESEAWLAVVPVQDVLGLGSEARMNNPARAEGNWGWRALPDAFNPEPMARFRDLARRTERIGPSGHRG